jgi:bacterioferritin
LLEILLSGENLKGVTSEQRVILDNSWLIVKNSSITITIMNMMRELDQKQTIDLLNSIIECELAGVVRYTHYSLLVTGSYRIPIMAFLKEQASESLLHAQKVGEIFMNLNGRPHLKISPVEETDNHSVKDILTQSLAHENKALGLYKKLLETVSNANIELEQFARNMISEEEMHNLELKQMLCDFTE